MRHSQGYAVGRSPWQQCITRKEVGCSLKVGKLVRSLAFADETSLEVEMTEPGHRCIMNRSTIWPGLPGTPVFLV